MTTDDAAIAARLRELGAQDQRERGPHGTLSYANDLARARELDGMLEQVGWPTVPRFGDEAVEAAWLVAQHCVMGLNPSHEQAVDLSFQRHVLRLMRPLRRRGLVPARHYAYLLDRIRDMSDRPQVFGTQYRISDDGSRDVAKTWHPHSLNARRTGVGLPTMPKLR